MYRLVTAPASEPVLLPAARAQCSIHEDDTSYDTKLQQAIYGARYQFEKDCPNIQLISATWCLDLDDWPLYNKRRNCHILLHKEPLIAISYIKYYPNGETELSEYSSENYDSDLFSYPGRILINGDFPDLNQDKLNNVQITFTCGYATADKIPGDIISALLLLIGHFFENPQQVMTGTQVNELPFGYKQIVSNHIKDWI